MTDQGKCSECIVRGIDCGPQTWPQDRVANLRARNNRTISAQTWKNVDRTSTFPQDRVSLDPALLFPPGLIQAESGVAQLQNLYPHSAAADQYHHTHLPVKVEDTFKAIATIYDPLSRTPDPSGPHRRNHTSFSNDSANVIHILSHTFPFLSYERICQNVESLAEENERHRTISRGCLNVGLQTRPQVTNRACMFSYYTL